MKRPSWFALTTSLASALAASLCAAPAFPCGAPFGVGVNVDPHQDIVVVHKAGVETYVFKPTFCGASSEFGLILPVPSLLTASPSLGNVKAFSTLSEMSKPRVEHRTLCGSPSNSDGRGWAGTGSKGMDAGAQVVASGRVGVLDWSQVEAKDRASFTAWLDANHYPYDQRALDAFDHYVSKHWYFLAFKIAGGDAGAASCNDLDPVQLSFPTAVPIVPSRMAAAGAKGAGQQPSYYNPSAYTWQIFGITEGTKEVGFVAPDAQLNKKAFSGLVTTTEAASLLGLADVGDRVTKLQLWLTGSETEDVKLQDAAGVDYREVTYLDTYVTCDAGADSAVREHDADAQKPRPDSTKPAESGPSTVVVDSAVHDSVADGKAAPVVDAKPTTPPPSSDLDTGGEPTIGPRGCSTAADLGATGGGLSALVGVALAAFARLRRRRRGPDEVLTRS